MGAAKQAKHAVLPFIVADIFQLAGEFRARGEAVAKMVGQTQARWQVLSAASGEPRTVPQIARRLGVTRQGVQRLADLLARDGLARFETNPDHKTSPYLVLTTKGRATLAQLSDAAARAHRLTADRLDDSEVQNLHRGVRRLLAALNSRPMEDQP